MFSNLSVNLLCFCAQSRQHQTISNCATERRTPQRMESDLRPYKHSSGRGGSSSSKQQRTTTSSHITNNHMHNTKKMSLNSILLTLYFSTNPICDGERLLLDIVVGTNCFTAYYSAGVCARCHPSKPLSSFIFFFFCRSFYTSLPFVLCFGALEYAYHTWYNMQ